MRNTGIFVFFVLFFLGGSSSAQSRYNILMYEGNQAFKSNKFEAATSKFMEVARSDEKDFAAHYNLGNSLYKSKKYEEAKAEFEKAGEIAQTLSDKASALHNLGNTYMKLNQPEKAAEYYKQSLKQEPHNEATRKNYEIAKLKEKQNQQNQNESEGKNGDEQDQGQQGDGKNQNEGQQGQGKSDNSSADGKNNDGTLPKGMEDAILKKIAEKERETARRILNKDSYSIPESNEKDW